MHTLISSQDLASSSNRLSFADLTTRLSCSSSEESEPARKRLQPVYHAVEWGCTHDQSILLSAAITHPAAFSSSELSESESLTSDPSSEEVTSSSSESSSLSLPGPQNRESCTGWLAWWTLHDGCLLQGKTCHAITSRCQVCIYIVFQL